MQVMSTVTKTERQAELLVVQTVTDIIIFKY